MKVTTLDIDLAKNVFQLHGVDEAGRATLHKRLSRGRLLGFLANLEPCLIGIEACAGANYWARVMDLMDKLPPPNIHLTLVAESK